MKANAAATRLPDFVEPMQAKLVDSMPPGDWIYEIKFDGYRALALRGGREARILSCNQKNLAKKFTEVRDSSLPSMFRMSSSRDRGSGRLSNRDAPSGFLASDVYPVDEVWLYLRNQSPNAIDIVAASLLPLRSHFEKTRLAFSRLPSGIRRT
jgi:hypothetical protein